MSVAACQSRVGTRLFWRTLPLAFLKAMLQKRTKCPRERFDAHASLAKDGLKSPLRRLQNRVFELAARPDTMNPTPAQTLKTAMEAMRAELAAVEKTIATCRYELRQQRQGGNVAATLLCKIQRTVTEHMASPEWRELDHGLNQRQDRTAAIQSRLAAAITRRDKLRQQARDAGVLL
jgi:hypothetical protein